MHLSYDVIRLFIESLRELCALVTVSMVTVDVAAVWCVEMKTVGVARIYINTWAKVERRRSSWLLLSSASVLLGV